jgi:endonuclease/exonuclease/phosphatase (EEP) superfamily protein YafD
MNGAGASSVSLCRKVAVAAVAMASILLLLSALGRWIWLCDLLAHFKVHLCVVLLLGSTASWICGERRVGTVGLLLVAVAAIPMFKYVRPRVLAADVHSPVFRLITFNIWHHNSEIPSVARFFERSNADVLVVQEATPMQARQLRQRLISYRYSMVDGTLDDGTIIFSRWPIENSRYLELVDGGARTASVSIRWREQPVQILGVHLHWPLGRRVSRFRNAELEALAALASTSTSRPLLVAGDFNITPWSSFYQRFVTAANLNDADVGQGLPASWPAVLGPLGIRIDHCLYSPQWNVIATRTGPELGSDHLPVIVDLRLRVAS